MKKLIGKIPAIFGSKYVVYESHSGFAIVRSADDAIWDKVSYLFTKAEFDQFCKLSRTAIRPSGKVPFWTKKFDYNYGYDAYVGRSECVKIIAMGMADGIPIHHGTISFDPDVLIQIQQLVESYYINDMGYLHFGEIKPLPQA